MRPPSPACIVFASVLSVGCQSISEARDPCNEYYSSVGDQISLQTQPLFLWFQAVKLGDSEQLECVFSRQQIDKFNGEDWGNLLHQYQKVSAHDFGDYQLEDLVFEYRGGSNSGEVMVVHNGNNYGAIKVVKEGSLWKVDEH